MYICVYVSLLLAIACNRFFTFTTIMASTLTHLKTHKRECRNEDVLNTTKRVEKREKRKMKKKIQHKHTLLFAFHIVTLAFRFTFLCRLSECLPRSTIMSIDCCSATTTTTKLLCSIMRCHTAKIFVVHNQKLIPYDIFVIFFLFIWFVCVYRKYFSTFFFIHIEHYNREYKYKCIVFAQQCFVRSLHLWCRWKRKHT